MAKKSSAKPKAKDKSQISIDGDLTGNNNVVGSNNVVTNIYSPEHIKLNALHQLPPAPADFTGRAELISQLLSDFNSHKGATISGLTGMGGIGKTALGLEVANQIKDQYQDAQIFLDLKGTTAPLSALDITRHVILSFEPAADLRGLNESNMQAEYLSVLHGKKALLFFDNARSAEQIAPLRPPADCAMLVTSRWTFPVTGLQAHRVDVLSEVDAVNFLLELCPRIADKAADLANACTYLPLALRIAGSFLLVNSDWSVEKYLSQLSDRKKRLETLKQSRVNAELTTEPDLLATFELSYTALPEDDRKRWRALGVFPASFTVNAAGSIWGLDENETAKLLGVLRRYSLLDYDEINSRYYLHDLLAIYALTQMEGEEEQESRIAHASYYMGILKEADRLYIEGNEKILSGLKLFDQEWEHIRFAQAWAYENIAASKKLAEYVMLYPNASVYCLDLRLAPEQKFIWLRAAVDAAKQLDRKDVLGAHLGNLGSAYSQLGDVKKAIDFHEQALVIYREIGDRGGEGAALGNLGIAYSQLGDVKKAIDFHEQALVIDREISNRRGEGADLGNLGNAYSNLGEVKKAIDFYKQRIEIAREIGDRRGEGIALGNLGIAYSDLGDVKKAIDFHEQSLVIYREIGDRGGEGVALANLGIAYYSLGDVKKAIDFHEQALVIDREIGDRRGEGAALGNLGNAFADLGDARKAIEFFEQALVIDREIGDRGGEGAALGNLGIAYSQLGDVKKAIDFHEQALVIDREIGDRRGEGAALGNLGGAYYSLGDVKKAIEFCEQQLLIAREIGDRRGEGNALFNMGLALYGLDEKDKAIDLVKQALVIFEAIESPNAERARNTLKGWGA